jgi:arylsulfatase A-like enzyme
MGALRAGLRKLGIAENTLVWFNSDNGGIRAEYNGGLRGTKNTIWEGGVRVPGIIEWPAGIPKAAVTDLPACTSDIYPTLLEIAGATVANQIQPLDGISLVPLLKGKMAERPSPIGFWHRVKAGGGTGLDLAVGHAALSDNRYKLHRLPGGKSELYDLPADRAESKDLAAEKPEVVARMKPLLAKWQESVARSFRYEDYRTAAGPAK